MNARVLLKILSEHDVQRSIFDLTLVILVPVGYKRMLLANQNPRFDFKVTSVHICPKQRKICKNMCVNCRERTKTDLLMSSVIL